MNRLLAGIAAVVLLVWLASQLRDEGAVSTAGAKPWPHGLGTLDDALARVVPQPGNDAASKLLELARDLRRRDTVTAFVLREIRSGELEIGAPPDLPDVSAVRDCLLGEPIVWERHAGFDHNAVIARRTAQMTMARSLIANALSRARTENPAAWDDLRATWILARSQDGHPQMMARTAALSMLRMINAVAWKMPLPVPDWWHEAHSQDPVRSLLEAFQYQVADYWKDSARRFPTRGLARAVDHDREIAETIATATGCEAEVPMNEFGTDLTSVWRRVLRFRVEREVTANALRIREGIPIETKSACGDATWQFEDGALRVDREFVVIDDDLAMPLAVRIRK